MCGIVAYIGSQPCGPLLLEGLARLEYRGYDSAGVAIFDGDRVARLRAEGKLRHLMDRFAREPVEGSVGIGHTRWATHGRPTENNAHPHMFDGVVVVHNGIIENYLELREELTREGHRFSSETDTETLAHLIARARRRTDTLRDAVREALTHVRGSYALVVLSEEEPDQLIATRIASPLVLGLGEGEFFAASDVPAILRHTRRVIFLEDGDLAVLRRERVEVEDAAGTPTERPVREIHWDPVSAEKQGYKHFMLKEIHEQPDRIIDTFRGRIDQLRETVTLRELDALAPALSDAPRILILACGTSYHAGLVGRYALEAIARVPVDIELASEFRYRDPVVAAGTIALAISQSGETADTLAALQEAAARGATPIAVCNVMESSLTRQARATLYTQAGPEIGVASTKAFTTQLAVLYLFALWMGRRRGALSEEEEASLVRALVHIPQQMTAFLEQENALREQARHYVNAKSMLFLGRGNQFPIALEGALKLKEISYIHAEGYAAGEMKHGPIALIDDTMPVVVIAPAGPTLEKTLSNMQEVRARGGRVIAVAPEGTEGIAAEAETTYWVPRTEDHFLPLLTVLPLQVFAYAIADARGTDVDQPRNLAKSVTVE